MRCLKFVFLLLFCFSNNFCFSNLIASSSIDPKSLISDDIEFSVCSYQNEKIKCQFLCLAKNKFALNLGKLIQDDLNSTDQLDIDLKKYNKSLDKKVLSKHFQKGISLFVFLSENKKLKENINIKIKDTSSEEVLFDQNFKVDKKKVVLGAHEISSKVLQALTGDAGPYLSSIAYCKVLNPNQKVVCVSDYLCKQTKTVVDAKTINIAPRWHSRLPILYYSQFTRRNNRLMAVDLRTRRRKIVFSYDGLNMQPSFSKDGSKAVLCLSAGGNSELYLYDKKMCQKAGKRVFKKLTRNKGNNISPCLLPSGNVIFCSDYQTGSPQIFILNARTKRVFRLTNGRGYCAAPSYCEKTNSIVYTRILNGAFQLFSLNLNNLNNLQEKQMTFDNADKREPTFSECGKYVIFSHSERDSLALKVPQIAILNLNSGRIRVLTSGKEPKSYPVWTNKLFFTV